MKDIYVKAFFDNQEKLFDFPVAETIDEAKDFLENDCEALIFDDYKDLIQYLKDNVDVSGVTKDNIVDEIYEVFLMPDGKYLYVEA